MTHLARFQTKRHIIHRLMIAIEFGQILHTQRILIVGHISAKQIVLFIIAEANTILLERCDVLHVVTINCINENKLNQNVISAQVGETTYSLLRFRMAPNTFKCNFQ